jgi:hypothetical protein
MLVAYIMWMSEGGQRKLNGLPAVSTNNEHVILFRQGHFLTVDNDAQDALLNLEIFILLTMIVPMRISKRKR